MQRRWVGPAGLVGVVSLATWLISGVAIFDIVRFLAYEAGFILVPGIALLWAVRGRSDSMIVTIALGWPIGQAVEILAFSATAALGARGFFLLYPVVVIALSAPVIAKRRRKPAPEHSPSATVCPQAMWSAATVISICLIYLAFMFLPVAPLPSATSPEAYTPDFVYFIGLTSQILHHWPPTSPGLSGVSLSYEWFVFFHMAAVAQVTRLSIATIALRLDYVPTIIVIGCQMFAIGRFLGRSAWTGVIAIVVVFLLGPLDLTTDATGGNPFFQGFFVHLWASWTFTFGLTFFLGLLYLISERRQSRAWRTPTAIGGWSLIVLLMIGASGAKATVLPVLIAGLALYAAGVVLIRRTLRPAVIVTLGIGVVVFAITFALEYGGGAPGTVIELFAPLAKTEPVVLANGITNPLLRAIALPFADLAGFAGMMLGLVGMLYLLRRRHRSELSRMALPICLFVAGVIITNALHQVAYSEVYFQDTGYVAGCLGAAEGLRLMWMDAGRSLPISRQGAIWAFATALAGLLVLVALTHTLTSEFRYAALAAGCVGFVLASAVVLTVRRRSTTGVLALGLIPLLASTALTSPLALSPTARKVLTGATLTPVQPDPQVVWGLTPGLLTALEWLQNHSSINAVLAVSNHWINPAKTDAREFYYSAFSEREVFVEAYDPARFGITLGSTTAASLEFASRQRLNDAVFNRADATALLVLIDRYDVRYLFIDRIHGSVDPAVMGLGRVVFTNADATILEVG